MSVKNQDEILGVAEATANVALQHLGPCDGLAALTIALTTLAASTCYSDVAKEQAKESLLLAVETSFDEVWHLPTTATTRSQMKTKPEGE